MANPGWHLDLYATDLTVHLIGTSSASMWWILPVHEPSADLFGGDGASIHPHTFMARLTLCAATMAEPEVSAVHPVKFHRPIHPLCLPSQHLLHLLPLPQTLCLPLLTLDFSHAP